METRSCKKCKKTIPETTRIDAVYCSAKCGWSYRNEKKRQYLAEKKKIHQPFTENIRIINDLFIKK